MTKARIFDETMAKGLSVTGLKVINIVVDYSAKMEALLVGMRKLMADLHLAVLPTESIDLTDFPKVRLQRSSRVSQLQSRALESRPLPQTFHLTPAQIHGRDP